MIRIGYRSGWISNLYYLTDSDLGFGYCPQVELDSGFNIFLGFGVGFSITLRLGWIMDLIHFSDLDSGLDSLILSNPNPNP